MNVTNDDCQAVCWMGVRGYDAECSLSPGHEGKHWDYLEGWEW